MSQVRRLDQIPSANKIGSADQFALWQNGRTRVGVVADLVEAAAAGAVPLIPPPTKADVGLGNADNTSDVQKPVSIPQMNAIADALASRVSASLAPSAISTTAILATIVGFRTNDGAKWKRGAGLLQRTDALGGTFSLDTSEGEVRADWLGAALDGAANDAAAINAGLALGLRVTLPFGKVAAIGSRILLNAPGATLAGFGTIKLLPGFTDDQAVAVSATGCRLANVLINGTAVTSLSRWVLSGVEALGSLATLDLDGVTVMGMPFKGISVGQTGGAWAHGRIRVKDCTVIDTGWCGMSFASFGSVEISGHYIRMTGYTAIDFANGAGVISLKGGDVGRGSAPSTIYSGPGNPNVDTSATSRAITGAGSSVSFTITKNAATFLGFYLQKTITIHAGSGGPTGTQDKNNFMRGQVTSYAGNVLTINVAASGGSGTFSNWTLFAEAGGLLGWLNPTKSMIVEGGAYADCLQGGYDAFLLGEDPALAPFGPTIIKGVCISGSRGGGIDVTSNMTVDGCDIRDCLNPILLTYDLGGFISDVVISNNKLINAGSTTGNNGAGIRFARAFLGANMSFNRILIEGNTVSGPVSTQSAIAFDSLTGVGYNDVLVTGNILTNVAGESFAWTGDATPPSGITFGDNEVKTPTGRLKAISAVGDALYPFGYKDYLLVSNVATNVKRIIDGAQGHCAIRMVANDSNTTLTPNWPGTGLSDPGNRLLMPGNNAVAIGGGSMIDFERQAPDRGWYAEIKRPYA